MPRARLLGPALALGLCSCAMAGDGDATALGRGDHRVEIPHAGRTRHALVHVPPGLGPGPAPALVLDFHGGGGTPEGHRDATGITALADREGFLVVHPAGVAGAFGRLRTWNAESCCGRAADEDVDDTGFVRALLAELSGRVRFDPGRVYAMGHSNGAMLAMRLAAEAPELLAGVATIGGAVRPSRFGAATGVPILHVHSIDDPRALYAGGLGPPFPFTRRRHLHPPVEAVLDEWRLLAGCSEAMAVVETREGKSDRGTPQTATLLRFEGCEREVAHWRLSGVGHGWPGARPRLRRLLGEPTRLIDANREAWRFFQRHGPRPLPL